MSEVSCCWVLSCSSAIVATLLANCAAVVVGKSNQVCVEGLTVLMEIPECMQSIHLNSSNIQHHMHYSGTSVTTGPTIAGYNTKVAGTTLT